MKITGKERLYWFCQLIAHGHSSSEAKRILDEAIAKVEEGNNEEENKAIQTPDNVGEEAGDPSGSQ